jgi:hypothetical protein
MLPLLLVGVRRIKSTSYISPHPNLLPLEKELETCVDTYVSKGGFI